MMKILLKIIQSKYKQFGMRYSIRAKVLEERGIFAYISGSSGFVLIIVLIISALLVTVSAEFLIVAKTNIQYIRKFIDKQKAETIARAGINLGTFILMADKKGMGSFILKKPSNKSIDSYDDVWALRIPELPILEGTLKLKISDQNSKININLLSTEVLPRNDLYYGITERFFTNMGLQIDLADIILDWVDIDDSRSPYGAEGSDYYMSLPSPYNAKNGKMDSIDELLMLKDFTPEVYYGLGKGQGGIDETLVEDNTGTKELDSSILSGLSEGDDEGSEVELNELDTTVGKEKSRRLSNYLRVDGDRKDYRKDENKININTAPFRVLSALTGTMTDDVVTELIIRRKENPFTAVSQLNDIIGSDADSESVKSQCLTVKSIIFQIEATGRFNQTTVKIAGIYNRDKKQFYYWGQK